VHSLFNQRSNLKLAHEAQSRFYSLRHQVLMIKIDSHLQIPLGLQTSHHPLTYNCKISFTSTNPIWEILKVLYLSEALD
jgi:hypothetical protein